MVLSLQEGSEDAYGLAYYTETIQGSRVLKCMPGKPLRNIDGSFDLVGQYWDGGLPCAVRASRRHMHRFDAARTQPVTARA
jgi:hypothetical protein